MEDQERRILGLYRQADRHQFAGGRLEPESVNALAVLPGVGADVDKELAFGRNLLRTLRKRTGD